MKNLLEVKSAELTGKALDWAVGKALAKRGCGPVGLRVAKEHCGACNMFNDGRKCGEHCKVSVIMVGRTGRWDVSGNPSKCMSLIELFKPFLSPPTDDEPRGWDAEIYDDAGNEVIGHAIGCQTAAIAVCRAVVLAYLGRTALIPAELVAA